MNGVVVAVCQSADHVFSKTPSSRITLRTGHGVEGDAHAGRTVQHLSRIRRDPTQPNLRQVHLIHAELFAELATRGFTVGAGDLGENITTRDVDLLNLPVGTRLHIGPSAIVELTGLRNPCAQLDDFQSGLLAAVLDRDAAGNVIRKSGVMGVVVADGPVSPDDVIRVQLPSEPYSRLYVV